MAVAAAAFGALVSAGSVVAAPMAPDSIATRQAGFKKMGAAMKTLKDALKGDAPGKAVTLGAVQTIAATAREQPKLFPAGSGPAAGAKTDALPNIWTNRAAFDAQMNKLLAESAKLLAVANGSDVAALRAQTKATGEVCAGCHRQFRADN